MELIDFLLTAAQSQNSGHGLIWTPKIHNPVEPWVMRLALQQTSSSSDALLHFRFYFKHHNAMHHGVYSKSKVCRLADLWIKGWKKKNRRCPADFTAGRHFEEWNQHKNCHFSTPPCWSEVFPRNTVFKVLGREVVANTSGELASFSVDLSISSCDPRLTPPCWGQGQNTKSRMAQQGVSWVIFKLL